MFGWFVFSFNCIAPILILVFMGYIFRQRKILTAPFLREGNSFCYHYCIPAMMFVNVYDIESLTEVPWALCVFVVIMLTVLTLIGLAAGFLFTDVHARRGVIGQAWMRSNSAIIGNPLAEAIGGTSALSVLAPLQIPAIIMYNSVSVIFLTIFSGKEERKIDWKKIFLGILTNPLILGLLFGLFCLLVRGLLPVDASGQPVFTIKGNLPFIYTAASYLARIATPLSLVILGGRFDFSVVGGMKKEIISTTAGRLIIAPLIGFGAFWIAVKMGIFRIHPDLTAALIPIFSSPVSVSTVPMASEMGADDVLAGQLLVWTSIGSMFTLFILIVVLVGMGWL